jgi:hypothetical protein
MEAGDGAHASHDSRSCGWVEQARNLDLGRRAARGNPRGLSVVHRERVHAMAVRHESSNDSRTDEA